MSDRRIACRPPLFVTASRIAIVAATLLFVVVVTASAATVTGRVTDSATTSGIPNVVVDFFEVDAIRVVASATTDGTGNYSASVPPGTYGIYTQAKGGYINRVYNNVPCSAVCDLNTISLVTVASTAISGINFALDPNGGRVSGKVTSSATGLPIAGVTVTFWNGTSDLAYSTAITDANGNYTSDAGSVSGNVFVFTTIAPGYQNEVYTNGAGNPHCFQCDPSTDGTAVAVTQGSTTANIDFILDPGGRIIGTATNAAAAPLSNILVDIADVNGNTFDEVVTDASGNYVTNGLPAGNYFAYTRRSMFFGLVDQVYNGITCIGGFCNPTSGTAISVTLGGVASGKNFTLAAGGTVTGTVINSSTASPLSDAFVQFFVAGSGAQAGQAVFIGGAPTNPSGVFTAEVPPGTVFAVAAVNGFANQVYNTLPCAGNIFNTNLSCNPLNGTPISVTAGATSGNINFSLVAPGAMNGLVSNAAGGAPLPNIPVQLFTSTGVLVGTLTTSNPSGLFTFINLAPGSYFVRTNDNTQGFINQLFNGVTCVGCVANASGGTPVVVTANNNISGVNFPLSAGGRITGAVTAAAGGAPIQGVQVQVVSSSGVAMGTTITNASGVYTSFALPAGTYYVRTAVNPGVNFVDEAYNDVPCVPCTVTTGTGVAVVGTSTTSNINFALAAGGSISGTITDAGNGNAPLAGLAVLVFDPAGVIVKNVTSGGNGVYTAAGLPDGTYYVRTNPNPTSQNYVTQVYSGKSFDGSATLIGTPVAVTANATQSGIDFPLVSGGALSGTVTDGVNPIANVQITVYSSTGRFMKTAVTGALGNYTVTGLAEGTYYASTSVSTSTPFKQDQLYNNIACAGCFNVTGAGLPIVTLPCVSPCSPAAAATAISVTNGATHSGVDFVLPAGGGAISGIVKSAATNVGLVNVQVAVFNAAGVLVKTVTSQANSGQYSVRGLAPGTYYARTVVSKATPYFTDQAYGGTPCSPCDVTLSTGIVVTANNTTTGVDFALAAGGQVTGTVTHGVSVNPIASVNVQLYDATGHLVKTTISDQTGAYTFDGLAAGSYFARTAATGYIDKLFDGLPCTPCTVTAGTAIVVVDGATRGGVNFGLVSANTTADFNGDGHPDVIWQNDSTRQVGAWYMGGAQGASYLGAGFLGAAGAVGVPGWKVVATADFNSDGHADVVWQNDVSRAVGVWYMGGAQGDVFLSASSLSVGVPGWTVVAVGDFNRDGHPDLVWQQDVTRQLGVWYMGGAQGDTFLSAAFLGPAGATGVPGWHVVGVGDFNRDGQLDVVWQSDATRQVAVWFMTGGQGNGFLNGSLLGPSGVPGWTVVGVADFNQDGIPDLAWQNDTTRQPAIWFMGGPQGTALLSATAFSGPGAAGVPGWRMIAR